MLDNILKTDTGYEFWKTKEISVVDYVFSWHGAGMQEGLVIRMKKEKNGEQQGT